MKLLKQGFFVLAVVEAFFANTMFAMMFPELDICSEISEQDGFYAPLQETNATYAQLSSKDIDDFVEKFNTTQISMIFMFLNFDSSVAFSGRENIKEYLQQNQKDFLSCIGEINWRILSPKDFIDILKERKISNYISSFVDKFNSKNIISVINDFSKELNMVAPEKENFLSKDAMKGYFYQNQEKFLSYIRQIGWEKMSDSELENTIRKKSNIGWNYATCADFLTGRPTRSAILTAKILSYINPEIPKITRDECRDKQKLICFYRRNWDIIGPIIGKCGEIDISKYTEAEINDLTKKLRRVF